MMKRMQRIAVLAMTLCLILGTMAVSVFAEGYEHQLTVSPGNGTGSKLSGKSIQITQDADPYTATLTVDGKTSKVTAPDQNHFVTGMKEAGRDNESAIMGTRTAAETKKDVEYVVAYGLRSNMIKYTVTYIDLTNGGVSLGSDTFYGVIGEKPVVTFKYFEGYTPANAYNITGTLERGKENVFNFEYYEVDEEGNVVTVVVNDGGAAGAGGAGGAAGGGAAGGAGGAAGGAAGGTTIADANTPQAGPADTIDLDNNKTPLAGDTNGDGVVDDKDISDNKTPGTDWSKVGIGAGAAAVVAIAAAIIAKRRKSEDEE